MGEMCRLFGQRADPDYQTHEPLCSSHNALRTQSHQHAHGWGIGWYVDGLPRVQRGVMPAHADDAFVQTARQARSNLVLAHVRHASVGEIRLENTHPFVFGCWLFAHNGTVARFKGSAELRRTIEAEIAPELRAQVRGDTDSERCFYLFLTRLSGRRCLDQEPALADLQAALGETVAIVSRIADHPSAAATSLNLLVSNGRLLAACRHGRPLWVLDDARDERLFAVASEPIGQCGWRTVPEDGFVGIDGEHHVLAGPLWRAGRMRSGG